MKLKITLIFTGLLIIAAILCCGFMLHNYEKNEIVEFSQAKINNSSDISAITPTSIQMYDIIENKSNEYGIPRYILYNVAWMETRYEGPFDWNYDPYQTSYMGASGPMQIIPQRFSRQYASDHEIKNDIEKNIDVSCKMLMTLYKSYGKWDVVLGAYNTGSPVVNDYASYGSVNKNYQSRWVRF